MADPNIQNPTGTFKPVYGEDDWFRAAYAYLLHGSIKKAAEEIGVPYPTVRNWKKEHPDRWTWFVEKARDKMLDKTVSSLNSILSKACKEIEKTLDEGEERVTKDGEVVRVRPPLASLNMVMGTTADKLHRIQGSFKTSREQPKQQGKRDKMHELGEIGRAELNEGTVLN